jgi:hypothetical protein
VHAPERLTAARVVARPEAIDALGRPVLRLAPDDALVPGVSAADLDSTVSAADPHAIVVDDAGFVAWRMPETALLTLVAPFVEWTFPTTRPALAQGLVAGVPAKVWLDGDSSMLACLAAHAHELGGRLP